METSPSRLEYEGSATQLFDCATADEPPQRRVSKAEALTYVRQLRKRSADPVVLYNLGVLYQKSGQQEVLRRLRPAPHLVPSSQPAQMTLERS